MVRRAVCAATLVAVTLGCGPSPHAEVVAPVAAPPSHDLTTLVFPTLDSATLASLEVLLRRLQEHSSLLSPESSDPRIYSLFRDLEAAQARLNARLSPNNPADPALDAMLERMSGQVDSVFRTLERMNRRRPHP